MSEDNMSELIDTFKNMLQSSNSATNNNSNTSSAETSTSPNTRGNPPSNTKSSETNNTTPSISPEMISNLANMLKNSNFSSNTHSSLESSNSHSSIDFETIMKIKSMMDTLNKKDDPRSNLLYSLKPYLRKTRQDKLDQYVNLLKITQISDIFNFKKGDKK